MKIYTLKNLDGTKKLVTSDREAFKIELKNMIYETILKTLERKLNKNENNYSEVKRLIKLNNCNYDELKELAEEIEIKWELEYK
ncbi:hypothetical protein [Staphylococcus agnetis]|uniref:hypothetical protein n=1 Tax=Staphylococcus agnetis TaxID=985762 RepID=UPI0039ED6A65